MGALFGFIGSVGTPEMIGIFILILLLFGADKVPQVMRSMGEGIREFKRSSREIMREFEDEGRRPIPPRKKYTPPSRPNQSASAATKSVPTETHDGSQSADTREISGGTPPRPTGDAKATDGDPPGDADQRNDSQAAAPSVEAAQVKDSPAEEVNQD